uniref:COPIIcoated_ERV domain-containing protein n=1 Tax=Rhabditophanes sp. KR3021 TaxID=114890 RepID=A0AC35TL07_9BILA
MSIFKAIRSYDLFSKPLEDFRIKTSFGGVISVFSFIIIGILFITETFNYMQVKTKESLYIDYSPGDTNVTIYFDLVFHKVACDFISVDALDQGGQSQENIVDHVFKTRLDKDGNQKLDAEVEKHAVNTNANASLVATTIDPTLCLSCYGARDGCCNTCEEVKLAYSQRGWQLADADQVEQCKSDPVVALLIARKGEGCRVHGEVQVAKSGGNFHIAPGMGESIRRNHVHSMKDLPLDKFDTSHSINHFAFGDRYPGKKFPLDGKVFKDTEPALMHNYYLKVVPTSFTTSASTTTEQFSYQFSATHTKKAVLKAQSGLPGTFFIYEFSPLIVRRYQYSDSFASYAVNLCAIIGGVYTVAALFDQVAYRSANFLKKTS